MNMAENENESKRAFKTFIELLNLAIKDDPTFEDIYKRVRDKSLSLENYTAVMALTNSYLESAKPEILNYEIRIAAICESFDAKWIAPADKGGYYQTTKNQFSTTVGYFQALLAERDKERNQLLRVVGLLNSALTQSTLELERLYSNPVSLTDEFQETITSLKKDMNKINDKIASLDAMLKAGKKK